MIEKLKGLMSENVILKSMNTTVQNFNILPDMVVGDVLGSDGKKKYRVTIANDGRCTCTHEHWKQDELCSHIGAVIENMGMQADPFIKSVINRYRYKDGKAKFITSFLPTDLRAINYLLGGLPVSTEVLVYAPFEAGKTILAMQLAFNVMQLTGGGAMIIDTEGSEFTYTEWIEIFNKRYGMNVQLVLLDVRVIPSDEKKKKAFNFSITPLPKDYERSKRQKLIIVDARGITSLLPFLGRYVRFETSELGKTSLKSLKGDMDEQPWETRIADIIKKNDVGFLALDSLTRPLDQLVPSKANLPGRAQATQLLLTQLDILAHWFSIPVVVTAHETLDPLDTFSKPEPKGGKNVHYAFKFVLYMSWKSSSHTPHVEKREVNTREIHLKRHPSKASFGVHQIIDLTNDGFVDYVR